MLCLSSPGSESLATERDGSAIYLVMQGILRRQNNHLRLPTITPVTLRNYVLKGLLTPVGNRRNFSPHGWRPKHSRRGSFHDLNPSMGVCAAGNGASHHTGARTGIPRPRPGDAHGRDTTRRSRGASNAYE